MTSRAGTPRVLVLGAGSAGARHVRLLAEAGASVAVADVDRDRAASCGVEVGDPERLEGYDGIVVATPTSLHAAHCEAALEVGVKVLVEKPLALGAAEADRIAAAAADRVMVGYNLRFHEPVQRIARLAEEGKAGRVSLAQLWFGSHLPDWRPASDYRTVYSARRELGGGVLLDAIHELDLAVWLFGRQIEVAGAAVGHMGDLEIDVEDTVLAVLRAPHTLISVSLDYLSRRYRRGIELVGALATLRLDWARGTIEVEDATSLVCEPAETPVQDSYRLQAEHFLAWLEGRAEPPVDAETAAVSVRLADQIRQLGA